MSLFPPFAPSGVVGSRSAAELDALKADKASLPVNIKDYGAIGDGASHHLQSVYLTLDHAQEVYPFVTDLTQEIDWAAYRAASLAAKAVGRPVYVPAGTYITDQTWLLLSACPVFGSGPSTTIIKRRRGAAIATVANAESQLLTGTDDIDCGCHDLTIDGNSPEITQNFEQGMGLELYAISGFYSNNLRIKDCPYSGLDTGGRACFQDNVGQINAAGTPPARPPRRIEVLRFTNLRTSNNGWQERTLTSAGSQAALTVASNPTDRTLTVGVATASKVGIYPGLKVGIGTQGSTTFELGEVQSKDTVAGTLLLKDPTLYAHAIGATADAVKYWSDGGFGTAIRQPCRDFQFVNHTSDRDFLGGFVVGQQSNIQYEPLNCRGGALNGGRTTRCSDVAPAVQFQMFDNMSISDYFIGDQGGELLNATNVGATSLTVKIRQGGNFYPGEKVYVGNPSNTATVTTTNASPNLTNVSNTSGWVNGQPILGAGIPGGTTIVSGAGTTTMVMSVNATASASNVDVSGASGKMESVTLTDVIGDVLTFPALTNAHTADEQVFCAMSAGLYVRQTVNTPVRGLKASDLTIRHCSDGIDETSATDLILNERHSYVNVETSRNRSTGMLFADASRSTVLGGHSYGNGVNGMKILETLTAAETHDLTFIGVDSSANPVNWVVIGGTYKSRACENLADA